ncbi:MAG: LPS assembly protein LptD, partial [Pseudomonadota bacterium]
MTRRLLTALCMAVAATVAMPAAAQTPFVSDLTQADPDDRMLLESDELLYNIETGRVTAVGNVFIHYKGYQLFATEVAYDQASNTLIARRGARLEEPGGNIIIAKDITLSDDLREGFLTGLRADTIFRTRLAANSAERVDGNVTIFQEAGYTACYSCRARPDKPPTWAIKARRVIVRENEKTLRFEEPRVELFGVTSPVLPSFTIPDPSVRRKSGFLVPTGVFSNLLGFGVRASYFQTLGPHRDITYGLTPLTRQGLFGDVEYRERTATGAYSIRATGIYQLDPNAFDDTGGDRRFRGSISTEGNFYINPRWQYGWESTISTDRRYLNDYKQASSSDLSDPTTIYLNGLGERNMFDARL